MQRQHNTPTNNNTTTNSNSNNINLKHIQAWATPADSCGIDINIPLLLVLLLLLFLSFLLYLLIVLHPAGHLGQVGVGELERGLGRGRHAGKVRGKLTVGNAQGRELLEARKDVGALERHATPHALVDVKLLAAVHGLQRKVEPL